MCIQSRMEQRARSRTLSDFELRKYAAAMIGENRNHPYWTNRVVSTSSPSSSTNETGFSRCKKAVTWNLKNNRCGCAPPASSDDDSSDPKTTSTFAAESVKSGISASMAHHPQRASTRYQKPSREEPCRYSNHEKHIYSSQHFPAESSCCQRRCSCYATCGSTSNIFSKSSSCSLLPTVDEQEPYQENGPRKPYDLQKIPSSSSLVRTVGYGDFRGLATCSDDSMVHVYAHVASVVPDNIQTNDKVAPDVEDAKKSGELHDPLRVPCTCCYRTRTLLPFRGAGQPMVSNSRFRPDPESRNDNRFDTLDSADFPSTRSNFIAPRAVIAAVRPTTMDSRCSDPTLQQVTTNQQNVAARKEREVEYAVVDTSKKNKFASSLPTLTNCEVSVSGHHDGNEPPVPPKKNLHTSDFTLHRNRDGSRRGFLERVQDLTRSARSAFQKAFSTERIYRPEKEERNEANSSSKLHRTKSFVKGIRASMSRKRKKKQNKTPAIAEVVAHPSGANTVWDDNDCGGSNVRGQLLQLNLDGSQVVELSKAPSKPYGFFVARGRVHNSKGVFVSRMRDQETQKQLAGLLDIGDEILEVEGMDVKNADILQVNDLISKKNTLLLTVLPYICRKDI